MIKVYLRNIVMFFVVVMLQVLVFDNMELSGYLNPYFYIIFILLMPFEIPGWLLLSVAFLLGLTIDAFSLTPGMHAAATVFMAFLRPFVLNVFAPRDGYETGTFPRIYFYGFLWFLKYSFILVLAHHLFLFSIEVFRIGEAGHILIRTLASAVFTTALIVLSQYFFYRK